ncbi:MAG: BMC domain-containing protein [Bacteroidota bacterium]
MLEYALGLVETRGLVGAIEAADAMVKTANVRLIGKERVDAALITIKIVGETAAVRSAVDAGASAAKRVGELISSHVIPRPSDGIEDLIFTKASKSKEEIEAEMGMRSSPAEPVESEKIEGEAQIEGAVPPVEPPTMQLSENENEFLQQLQAMTVPQLRSYARQAQGLSIYGRQISRANKEQLIAELMKAKFGK